MPSNIEIKARVDDPAALLERVRRHSDAPAQQLQQDDTFFHCRAGRLKLRDFGDGTGELIAYRRADESGPKASQYRISPTQDPAGLRETLSDALGVLGRVRKSRQVIMVGRTRVHLDEVEGLGHYMELEVVLADDEPPELGVREAQSLMEALAIDSADLVEGAYLDRLLAMER
jgi:predicted adenylyl cyclase CyaB